MPEGLEQILFVAIFLFSTFAYHFFVHDRLLELSGSGLTLNTITQVKVKKGKRLDTVRKVADVQHVI